MLDGHPPTATPAGRSASTTDVDPGRHGADAIISYITQAITASNQPAHCGRALIRLMRDREDRCVHRQGRADQDVLRCALLFNQASQDRWRPRRNLVRQGLR